MPVHDLKEQIARIETVEGDREFAGRELHSFRFPMAKLGAILAEIAEVPVNDGCHGKT